MHIHKICETKSSGYNTSQKIIDVKYLEFQNQGLRENDLKFKNNLDYMGKPYFIKPRGKGAVYLSCTRPWVPA